MEDTFDPLQRVEIAMIRAEHQKRYQSQIALLKEQVGEGISYRNGVVQVVVSETGAYYELNDLPEEFAGGVGDNVSSHFVTSAEAIDLLTRAVNSVEQVTSENTFHISIFVLYTRRGLADRKNCYVFEYRPSEQEPNLAPMVIGAFQPDLMPLFFKAKIDSNFASEALEFGRGMIFCMANAGDRNLLIQIPYTGTELHNLNAPAGPETIQ